MSQAAIEAEAAAANDRATCGNNNANAEAAIAACTRQITSGRSAGHNLAIAHYNRGLRWYRKGDFDRAIFDFNDSLRSDPAYATVYIMRGLAWYNKKQIDRALSDFNQLISLDPTNSLAYNNAAWMRLQKGDLDGALEDANRAIQYDSNSAAAWSTRGEIRRAKGDLGAAISDLTKSISLHPSLPAFASRGLAYENSGDYKRALDDYSHALTLSAAALDDREAADMARRRINRVRGYVDHPLLAFFDRLGIQPQYWPLAAGVLAVLLAVAAFSLFRDRMKPSATWRAKAPDAKPGTSLTDFAEAGAYFAAHALGLLATFIGSPKLISLLLQTGMVGNGKPVSLAAALFLKSILSALIVMVLFFAARSAVLKHKRRVTPPEIAAYFGADSLYMTWFYLTAKTVFGWIIANGYLAYIMPIQAGIAIVAMIVAFVIFIFARQLLERTPAFGAGIVPAETQLALAMTPAAPVVATALPEPPAAPIPVLTAPGEPPVTSPDPRPAQSSPAAQAGSRTPRTAYLLNLVLPGAGNIYFGQPIIGTIFILGILFGLFLLFVGAGAAVIGLMIIVASLLAAIFTFGLSLLVGLPIGLIFVMMGAGPLVAFVIWLFSLLLSEILVHSKAAKAAPAT
jgi:tetratricopeptide (TPR) repeat protein